MIVQLETAHPTQMNVENQARRWAVDRSSEELARRREGFDAQLRRAEQAHQSRANRDVVIHHGYPGRPLLYALPARRFAIDRASRK